MPDLTLCANGDACPDKDACERWVSRYKGWGRRTPLSWANFEPTKGRDCPGYATIGTKPPKPPETGTLPWP